MGGLMEELIVLRGIQASIELVAVLLALLIVVIVFKPMGGNGKK